MLGKQSGVLADLVRGGACGLAGGTLQVAVGWLLSQTLLPPWEDNNIAPRLMQRSLSAVGQRPSSGRNWVLGTLFHYAYGFAWGAVLARGRALSNLPALVVAAPVSLVVYTLAFSRVGAGTLVRAEAHPAARPANKQASLLGWWPRSRSVLACSSIGPARAHGTWQSFAIRIAHGWNAPDPITGSEVRRASVWARRGAAADHDDIRVAVCRVWAVSRVKLANSISADSGTATGANAGLLLARPQQLVQKRQG
jgi:hypothetical protein